MAIVALTLRLGSGCSFQGRENLGRWADTKAPAETLLKPPNTASLGHPALPPVPRIDAVKPCFASSGT